MSGRVSLFSPLLRIVDRRCNWRGVSNNSLFMLRRVQHLAVGVRYDNTPSLARKNSSLGQSK